MPNRKNNIIGYVTLIIVIIIALEVVLFLLNKNSVPIITEKEKENALVNVGNGTIVKMKLPAVDSEGNGVSTLLTVEAVQGTGRTLADIENLLFWADTQQSIRMARLVATNFSIKNINDYDLIYGIEANASLIGGPSAGAAITIATILALNNETPNKEVMITGAINHDGSIGPVSGILEKANASKQAGAKIFLVPLLQSRDVIYETIEHCEKFGLSEICQTETTPRKINVSEEAGIQVIEVADISEALRYFKI